jgi:hypothetical protein
MRTSVAVTLPAAEVTVLAAVGGICVTLESNEVAVMANSRAVSVTVPDGFVTVAGEAAPIDVQIADGSITITCDDILSPTFTTPTLTSWACTAEDHGTGWVQVHFAAVTAGSPCRVKFRLTKATHPDMRGGYSAPEQLTPHSCMIGPLIPGVYISDLDRGIYYDLYWSWTSGMSSAAYALVAADAVYVPSNGEGDFPSEG